MFDEGSKKNKEYKNCENASNKYNPAISFFEEDVSKIKKETPTSSQPLKADAMNKNLKANKIDLHNNDYIDENNNNYQNDFHNNEK